MSKVAPYSRPIFMRCNLETIAGGNMVKRTTNNEPGLGVPSRMIK